MPFSGALGLQRGHNRGCGAASGQTSHPSCHEIYSGADWSTDLYAPDGTDVRLRLTANFTPTFEFIATSDGSCGHRVSFRIKNGSTVIGRIYFDHLKNEVNSTAEISNGGVLGKVDQTCHVGFAHTHIEVQGFVGRLSATPTTASPVESGGAPLSDGNKIGQLVSTVTGSRQVCPNTPPSDSDGDGIPDASDQCPSQAGAGSTGGCPDRDGDGVADSTDACPTNPGPASTTGCPRIAIVRSAERAGARQGRPNRRHLDAWSSSNATGGRRRVADWALCWRWRTSGQGRPGRRNLDSGGLRCHGVRHDSESHRSHQGSQWSRAG